MTTRGVFVNLEIDPSLCAREALCQECVASCPVNVFTRPVGGPACVITDSEDECILCQICVDRCPVDAVALHKLY